MTRLMHTKYLLCIVALAGCSHAPPQFEGGPMEELDDSTKYHLVDHDDGYEIHVFHERSADRADSAFELFFDLLSLYLGVPSGDSSDSGEFLDACTARLYSAAVLYARSTGEESEFKAKAGDVDNEVRHRVSGSRKFDKVSA